MSDAKRAFLVQLSELRELPKNKRSTYFEILFSRKMIGRQMSSAEMFEAAYGDSGQSYWRSVLSEPMRPADLAWHLGRHLTAEAGEPEDPGTEDQPDVPQRPEDPGTEDQPDVPQRSLELAVLEALKDGLAGRLLIAIEPPAILSRDNPEEDRLAGCFADSNRRHRKRPLDDWQHSVRLDPSAAVRWLMGAPMRQHLVPVSLRRYLLPATTGKPARLLKPEQEEVNRALLDYANKAGRKLKQTDGEAQEVLTGLNATSRQKTKAFQKLPCEYRFFRGKPVK